MSAPNRARTRRRAGERCPLCGEVRTFFWRCACGFAMCDHCMKEEAWGMTCNQVTWDCPDCGTSHSY